MLRCGGGVGDVKKCGGRYEGGWEKVYGVSVEGVGKCVGVWER